MLKFIGLFMMFALMGCAKPMDCYRIVSADTWVSGGPNVYRTVSQGSFLSDRTHGDGWNIEGGVNFHWDPSSCEWEYYEEEAPLSPAPGGSGGPSQLLHRRSPQVDRSVPQQAKYLGGRKSR